MATAYMYGNAMLKALSKEVDYEADTIKCALLEDTYTPDIDADIYYDDVSANETSGTGYTAGGEELTNKSMTYDSENDTVVLDADDVSWTESTITARYAVIYDDTGTESTSVLLGYVDFGSNQSSSNGTFQITWNSDGIFNIVANPA